MGPNGSGKSSIIKRADIYARSLPENYQGDNRDLKAAEDCEIIRMNMIESRKSFVFETVGSTKGKLDELGYAKECGFKVEVLFITTNDPSINITRIHHRKLLGGHGVDDDKVRSRYIWVMSMLTD